MTVSERPKSGTKRIPSSTSSVHTKDIEETYGQKLESVDIIQERRRPENENRLRNGQNNQSAQRAREAKTGRENQSAQRTGNSKSGRKSQNAQKGRNVKAGKSGKAVRDSATSGPARNPQRGGGHPVPAQRGKKPKRKKSGKKFLVGLLCTIIILAGLGFLVIVLFEVKAITITGNQYCSEEEIIDWLTQDAYSNNALYLLWKYNQNDVEQLPAVEEAKVGLKDLTTVSVQVKEKTFSGRIDYAGKFLYFDQQGKAALVTDSVIEGVPYIEGMEINEEEITLGQTLPEEEGQVYEEIKELIPLLEKQELSPDKISCAGLDLTLHFGGVRVQIGNGKFSDRLAQVPPILEKLTEMYAGQPGVLHLENYDASGSTIRFVPDTVEAPANAEAQTEGEGEEEAEAIELE